MAGYWIPWEVGLTKKREIIMIAQKLAVSRREAAAMCMEVWEWASDQSVDGLIVGVTASGVSDALDVPGLGEAMELAGWLLNGDGNVQFPNWTRYNGRSARARLQAAYRKREQRARAARGRHA